MAGFRFAGESITLDRKRKDRLSSARRKRRHLASLPTARRSSPGRWEKSQMQIHAYDDHPNAEGALGVRKTDRISNDKSASVYRWREVAIAIADSLPESRRSGCDT
jgi:hypothetical protein